MKVKAKSKEKRTVAAILCAIASAASNFAFLPAGAEEEPINEEAPAIVPANLPRFHLPAQGSLPTEKTADEASPAETRSQLKTPRSSIAISSPAEVPKPTMAAAPSRPQETVLPNGLKVVIQENHEFPVVSTLVWYKVGSRDEQTGATGLSHMVEHLMFQEVGPFKPGDIGSMIARVGGQFNGYTSDDFTTFFETLPASKLEMALKIESERMHHTRFSESEVKQEIANIQAEFDKESKDPVAILSNEVRAMMFMQHPYHNPTLGWKTDVESLNKEHAAAFYEKYFHPNNATLVITGDCDGKQTLALVRKYFGEIQPSPKPVLHTSVNEPLPRSERRVNTKYQGNKEILQLAYRSPAMEDADAAPMVVLEHVLNGGMNGRLKSRLIDSKICNAAQASFEIKKEPGLFTITCTATPGTYNAQAKILENLDAVISQIREKPLSDAEIRRARNQAEFAFCSECDGPYRAGFHLGYFESLDKWQNSYSWPDKLKAVSAADLNRVAKKYLHPDARVVGWIAGTSAPKSAAPKPPETAPPPKEQQKSKPEHTKLTGYKENDEDIAPKNNKTKEKKSGMPAVMRDIPQALGNAVTGNLPGAVGNVGSAIVNLPGAIGDIGTAVGSTATAIGKQIAQLKPPSEQDSPYLSHRVLKNGINLIVFESHISPIVQLSGSIQAGEAYSNRNKPASSLLAASTLSQGSAKRNRAQMMTAQDELGISTRRMLRFESGIETIDFSTRCLSRDLQTQMDLLAEVLSQPALDASTLERAKQDALSQLKRNEESVAQKVDRVVLQGLLDENSTFCPADPVDRAKAAASIDLAELQKFFANHIVPGATTLVVAGDCSPEQVFAAAEKSLEKWAGKSSHSQLHAKLRSQRVLRSSLPIKDIKKSSASFGQVIPMTQSHPDFGSLLIADSILVNHPMFSRFEQAISKNPSLENAISNGDMAVRLDSISNMTRWSLTLSLEPQAVPLSVKTIKSELKQLTRTGVTPEEFIEAKRYLQGSIPVKTRSTLEVVSNGLLDSVEHSNSVSGYSMQMASVKAATLDSVNKVIRSAFKPEQSTLVIAGGGESIRAVRTNQQTDSQASSQKQASGTGKSSDKNSSKK